MIKVLFICHGNICRSTMAQFLFRYLAEQNGMTVAAALAAAEGIHVMKNEKQGAIYSLQELFDEAR